MLERGQYLTHEGRVKQFLALEHGFEHILDIDIVPSATDANGGGGIQDFLGNS